MQQVFENSLFLIALPLGCQLAVGQSRDYKHPALPIEKRIDNLLGQMTTEEKINQLVSKFPKYTKNADNTLQVDAEFQAHD